MKLNGLNQDLAKQRLETLGKNKIPEGEKTPIFIRFISQFKDIMVVTLFLAALVSFFVGEKTDASIIIFIVILNAIIGFTQEYKADKALEALKKMVTNKALVIRDGKKQEIESEDIVVGDLIVLETGRKVPADAVLIREDVLKINESALTGESLSVDKAIISEDGVNKIKKFKEIDEFMAISMDKKIKDSMRIFMGTEVVYGNGLGIVYATGKDAKFGTIASETLETKKDLSPLKKELLVIGKFVGKVALFISAFLFLIGFFFYNHSFADSLVFAVSVAVAAVPEGLLATITIALALGVRTLARKKAIVKKLSAVETLGGVTVICSDKTGTLTKNQMTVAEIFAGGKSFKVSGTGYGSKGTIEGSPNKEILEKMSLVSMLCNNVEITEEGENFNVIGDPTEGALIPFAQKAGFDKKNLEEEYERVREIQFDEERKMMSVINRKQESFTILSKGAIESILAKCSKILDKDGVRNLNEKEKTEITSASKNMAKEALRVLAFAYKDLESEEIKDKPENVERDLVFLGLVGMIDPPRDEVKDAIEKTGKAGVRVVVITGDSYDTARAIGESIGLFEKQEEINFFDGEKVENLSGEELSEILKDKSRKVLFARISPLHKKKIVKALQKNGEIVAVTGDGVNDAPALKKGDIGVAMGITGTDVSREASDMVLTDDSFATIVTAIFEGRVIYDNLRKFIFYIFSCNIAELFTVFSAMILRVPMPITAIMILLIDLGTDVLPALALGIDTPEKGILDRDPRDPREKIMNKKFIIEFTAWGFIIGSAVMFLYTKDLENESSKTLAFVLLIIIQMFNAFTVRSLDKPFWHTKVFSNLFLWFSVGVSFLMSYLFTNFEIFRKIFHTTALALNEWLQIFGICVLVFVIGEVLKIIKLQLNIRQKA